MTVVLVLAQNTIHPLVLAPPEFTELETKPGNFRQVSKVIDLLAPYRRGGKIGLFGGAELVKQVTIMELINNIAKAHGGVVFAGVVGTHT